MLGELEAQEIVEEDSSREFGKALGIKEYLYLDKYDKAVMASLIVSAKVMGEDRLEITWKHQDVYEKILGEMQGEYGTIRMSARGQAPGKDRKIMIYIIGDTHEQRPQTIGTYM